MLGGDVGSLYWVNGLLLHLGGSFRGCGFERDRTDGEESNTTPSQSRSSSIHPQQEQAAEDTVDVFDGYSFKGRHSVLIDDEKEEESAEESEDEDERCSSNKEGLKWM